MGASAQTAQPQNIRPGQGASVVSADAAIAHALDTSGLIKALRAELAGTRIDPPPTSLSPVSPLDVAGGALQRATGEVTAWS